MKRGGEGSMRGERINSEIRRRPGENSARGTTYQPPPSRSRVLLSSRMSSISINSAGRPRPIANPTTAEAILRDQEPSLFQLLGFSSMQMWYTIGRRREKRIAAKRQLPTPMTRE